jgi:hypothetical protein
LRPAIPKSMASIPRLERDRFMLNRQRALDL